MCGLAAGGGYAFASSVSSNTITVCVSHAGGTLYKAKKCAKHDKKLTWNKQGPQGIQGLKGDTGPQGPGATYLVHNASGTAAGTPTPIGTIGPWAADASCHQSGSTTDVELLITGPGATADELVIAGGSTPVAESNTFGPQTNGDLLSGSSSSTTAFTSSGEELLIPTSGTAVKILKTISVTGGATNTCHVSVAITPTAPAAS